VVKICTTCCRV